MKDLNFFSPFLKEKKSKKKKIVVPLLLIFLLMFIPLGWFVNEHRKTTLEEQLLKDEEYLSDPKLVKQRQEFNITTNKYRELTEYKTHVDSIWASINKADPINSNMFLELSKAIPKIMTLNMLTVLPDSITIQGNVSDRKSVAEFQHNLKQLPFIETVQVISITPEGTSYVVTMKCVTKDVNE